MDKPLMTPEQLAAIRARAEDNRLPPAPWRWHYYSQYLDDDRGTLHAPCTPSIIAGDVDEVTGQFIAHARADIPALLDHIETLQAKADALAGLSRDAIQGVEDWGVYASDYFKEKHGLDAEVEGYKELLDRILNGAGNESEGA